MTLDPLPKSLVAGDDRQVTDGDVVWLTEVP